MFCLKRCMKKLGGVLLIIGIIFIVLVLGTGIYFYNFHIFGTVRLCVGEVNDIGILCEVTFDCTDLIRGEIAEDFSDAPDFIQENFQKVIEEIVYCDGNCFVRDVRGIDLETGEFEMLDSCRVEEKEIVIGIRGKDGLEIWKYLENKKLD